MIKTAIDSDAQELGSGHSMRIVSLLPSATEILYALGLGDAVVGVTHECDYPPAAAAKPPLIKPRVDAQATPSEIDRQVTEFVRRGESIYAVDAELLASLTPDLILTQDLCHVCAASPDDLASALTRLPKMPRALTLTPHSIDDVWQDILRVGEATRTTARAQALTTQLKAKVKNVELMIQAALQDRLILRQPRVLCLEWLEPFYVGGHWVPEMVSKSGGKDLFGRAREPSFKVSADELSASGAELIVVMLCGYNAARNAAEFRRAKIPENWNALPAIRDRRIFAVDANSYFSRPGPRLADGVELMAHLLHPDINSLRPRECAYQRL
ncbi:MAG: cobalamin-binding protein [Candidatus Acidiferrales bacterium]